MPVVLYRSIHGFKTGLERLLFKNLGFIGFSKNLKILKNPKIRFLGFSNLNFLKI
jgi:hypothetical protein